jgi:hypothetical protein
MVLVMVDAFVLWLRMRLLFMNLIVLEFLSVSFAWFDVSWYIIPVIVI